MNLAVRSELPEELDCDDVDPETYRIVLSELDTINRITMTHQPMLRWLEAQRRRTPAGKTISVLDVACGHGDLLRAIATWAAKVGQRVRLVGLDMNPRSAEVAQAATPGWMNIEYVTGDVFDMPNNWLWWFDFVVTSQFTHHLTDEQIVRFLVWLDEKAARGWHIADLHRNALAYHGFSVLAKVMGWHRITRSDGMISVARSFRRRDWEGYLWSAGMEADIAWHMGFRYCVSRVK